MLGALTQKLQGVFSKLGSKRKLTEENIFEAVGEVRLALLEADVNYGVTKTLIQRVKNRALGESFLSSVTAGQQFIKIVHDELITLMGGDAIALDLAEKPSVIMLCGLQGSGKTTHCAKLAHLLLKEKTVKKPLLAACDLQRPAAVKQLQTLGGQIEVDVFSLPSERDPVKVAKAAVEEMKRGNYDVLIVDTAGRLHIDEEMMGQLKQIKSAINPSETLFVANSTTGQDAVNIAAEFAKCVEITGTILTMLDGNTRGGAAISIREVTGKPLKYEGVGERIEDIQPFHPQSMADRILGMGDTINLVRKAQEHIDEEQATQLEEKIRKATFTYDDYVRQIQSVKKMGSIKGLLSMLPGISTLGELDIDDREFAKIEAIILSMTLAERKEREELVPSRRRRIANGSGTTTEDVNKLVKSFKQTKQFFKNMPAKKNIQKMLGGALWR